MSRGEIIAMAREAGFMTGVINDKDGRPMYPLVQPVGNGCIVELERFASLVAAAEREAMCAVVNFELDSNGQAAAIIAVIRARGPNGS